MVWHAVNGIGIHFIGQSETIKISQLCYQTSNSEPKWCRKPLWPNPGLLWSEQQPHLQATTILSELHNLWADNHQQEKQCRKHWKFRQSNSVITWATISLLLICVNKWNEGNAINSSDYICKLWRQDGLICPTIECHSIWSAQQLKLGFWVDSY